MGTKTRKRFLLCVVAFLALITMLVFSGCKSSCKKTPPFVDQGEVGSYYYYAEEGTYSLALDENKFTLSKNSENLEGTYTFDGTNMAFTFADSGNSVNVNYKVNMMSFSYKGVSYTFYRNVDYTVTFSGVSANAVTVTNGKKCQRPADPEKEGYLFVNWYKDDNTYLEVFDFDKEIITENTTVYARFVAKESYDYEFTVSFETGVDGLKLEDVQTFNNTLYNLPTVNAEGKTFVGWWVSDYDDALKLSYQYMPTMSIKQDMTLYAVYASDEPLVSVENDRIVWDNKGVNKQYAVNIKNADDLAEEPLFTRRVSTTYVEYNFNDLPAGNYLIEVTTGNYTGKAYYCNKKLDTVCKFEVDEFKLSWNKVENATNYLITVECGLGTHKHTLLDLGNVNEYDFSECLMTSTGIKFTVTAKAKDYMSSTSKEYVCYRELDQVTNVTVDAANQTLTWDAVKGAASYKVTILAPNGQTYTYTPTTNSLAIDNFYGQLSFTVTPVAQGCYAKTTEYSYNKTSLVTPTNIKVLGYDVSWDAVEGAVSYNLQIGNKSFTSLTNSYTLTLEEIQSLDQFKVSVQAVAEDASNNSLYSPSVTINENGVNEINFKNGVISWNSVPFVAKYAVKVDDSEVLYVENDVQVAYKITSGKHTIYVAAIDADGNWDQFYQYSVEVYALVLNTRGGVELESLYFVKGDTISELPTPTYEGYDFLGWYTEEGATSQEKLFTEKVFNSDIDVEIYASWNGKKYAANLDYATYGFGDESKVETQFGSSFKLPVPKTESNLKAFIGWYSELNAQGERYTDENGKSLKNWRDYSEITLYAGWVDVFTFSLINNGTAYSVSKGPGIQYVSTITIPTTYLELPITTVEASAFQSCSNLVEINIPCSIVNIETGSQGPNGTGSCFQSCTNLRAVNIYPVEGVHEEDIRYYSIEGVLIYNNEYNGYEIKYFPYNTKSGTYTIPNIVTTIPINAFKSCTKITEIIIPASVTKIDESAFQGCSQLTTITFLEPEEGETVKELILGEKVFQSNSALEVINLPARLKSFNPNIFTSCSKLHTINVTGEYENASYSSLDGVLLNAEKTEILYFPRAKGATYTTPVGVQKIAESAFESCKELTEINISGQVTLIGKNAFKSCTNLEKINFLGEAEDAPLTIEESAFYGCNNAELTELVLPANLFKMEKNAFGNTSKLYKVSVNSVYEQIEFAYAAFGTTVSTVTATPTYYVTTLYLSKDVAAFDITGVFGSTKLSNVTVEEGNPNYTAIDGILYNSQITKVIYYPTEREGSYVLPSTIVEISDRVFEGRKGLTSVTIGKNVTTIGNAAFQNCTSLTEVIFEGDGTEELIIGTNAFQGCSILEKLELPTRLTEIGDAAFANCKALPSIVIPEGVKIIGAEAFRWCFGLVKVTLPSTIETLVKSKGAIDGNMRICVFDYCNNLVEFEFSGENNFYKAIDGILYGIVNEEDGTFKGYELIVCPRAKGGVIDLPSSVLSINPLSFYENSTLEEVTFSNGIDKELVIGEYSFYQCVNLARLNLPNGLKELKTYSFYNCKLLEEITIPNTVEFISKQTFYNCTALSNVVFEEGGTAPLTFGDGSMTSDQYGTFYYGIFSNCGNVESLIFPERLSVIGKYAFAGMSNVKTVYIPSTTQKVGDYAFYHCDGLTNLSFAENASELTLGSYAFAYTQISGLTLPEGLKVINSSAFISVSKLASVVIPASVTEIKSMAFYNCGSLTSLTFAAGSQLESIGSNAFYMSGLNTIKLPQSLKEIGDYAFQKSKNLVSVEFEGSDTEEGSSLRKIGSRAFSDCTALTSFSFPYCGKDEAGVYNKITLGSSATSVHIFEGCKNLSYIYLSEAVTSISNLFVKCSGLETVVVAQGSENFKVSETQPIILNVNGTAIQFLFGRMTGVFEIPEGVTEIGTYAFSGQADIKKVIIPKSMKTINANAFYNCTGLEEVEFANGCVVDTLGEAAFKGCSSLKKIVLPNGITSLPKQAFAGCSSLESVTLPEGLTTIGVEAFTWTASLKSIKLPSSLITIDNYGFAMSGLETLVLPEGLTKLGTYTFEYSASLKEVTLPSTITSWGNQTFTNCTSLETVNFAPDSTTIGQYLFIGCTSLESITLPEGLTSLGSYVFQKCTGLKSIVIPESVQYIGASNSNTAAAYTFDGCTALESVTFLGDNVKIIGTYAFRDCTSLKEITLPSELVAIGQYAFSNSGLTETVIPEKVVVLGNYAYKGCLELTKADIRGKITTTSGTNVFQGCTELTDVTFADDTTTIGNYAFDGCTKLVNVKLPAKLTSLGTYAFQNCTSLKEITLPASLVKIGSTTYSTSAYTFSGCTALEKVEILGKATYIGAQVFRDCTSLKSITLPATVTQIGGYAFYGSGLESIDLSKVTTLGASVCQNCADLKNATLPDIATLPNYTFSGCTSLTSVVIPAKTTRIGSSTSAGYTFDGCTSLKEVKILGNLIGIGLATFRNCTSLTSLDVPATLQEIGGYAFMGSGITNFNIPAKVTKIGYAPFNACPDLASVTIDGANTAFMVYENMAIIDTAKMQIVSVFNCQGDYELPEGIDILGYALNGVTVDTLTLPDSMTTLLSYALYGLNADKVVFGSGLASIPAYVLKDSNVKTVVFNAEEVTILNNAFENSTITTIENSENIVSIGTTAFKNCKNLKTIEFSNKLLEIKANAFEESGLTSINIPGSVEWLGTYSATNATTSGSVFKNCLDLTSVTLNDGLKVICNYAFQGSGIKSITVPASVQLMGSYMCQNALSLESATIQTTSLGTYAFDGCTALTTVQLADNTNTIVNYMFRGCTSLASIELPDCITEIGLYAFENCTSMTQIVLPTELKTIQTAAFKNTGLTSVKIPSKVTNIFGSAFENCANLVSVELNEGLETLGTVGTSGGNPTGNVFKNCVNLEFITLPKSLVSIGSNTFQNCTKIKSVVIYDECIAVGAGAFSGWTSEQKVYVIASKYDITSSWYDNISTAYPSGFYKYWSEAECEFVFEYQESAK